MNVNERIPDVPVFVDARVGGSASFAMTRCSFLMIECNDPMPGWTLSIGRRKIPFLLLEMAGIIGAPLKATRFRHVHDIGNLYTAVEDMRSREQTGSEFLVETGDFWLPDFLFGRPAYDVGDVFRVKRALFNLGLSYRNGDLDTERFVVACENFAEAVSYSEQETEAFRVWHEIQAREARQQFPKNPEGELKRKGDDPDDPAASTR